MKDNELRRKNKRRFEMLRARQPPYRKQPKPKPKPKKFNWRRDVAIDVGE